MQPEVDYGNQIIWTPEDREDLSETFKKLSQINGVVYDHKINTPPTETINQAFDSFSQKKKLLEKAVDSNLTGTKNYDTLITNYLLKGYLKAASRIYYDQPDYNQRISFAVELLGKQVDHTGQILLGMSDPSSNNQAEELLNDLAIYIAEGKNPDIKAKAIKYFQQSEKLVSQILQPDKLDENYMSQPLALTLYAIGDPEQKLRAKNIVMNILKSNNGSQFFDRFEPDRSSYIETHKLEPYLIELISSEIDKYGLDTDRIIYPWIKIPGKQGTENYGDLHSRRTHSICETIKNLDILDKERPGSPRILHEMFGINHFGRYPIEVLIKQFDNRFDTSKPYGVLLGTSHDRNEVSRGSTDAYKSLFDQLGDSAHLRVIECSSKSDILLEFWKLNHRYNPKDSGQKIGFLVINGHGNLEGDTIWLGDKDKPFGLKTINTRDLERVEENLNRNTLTNQFTLNNYFVDNMDIVLISCNIGLKLAGNLSKLLHSRVFASTGGVNRLDSIDVDIDQQKINLHPTLRIFNDGKAVVFNNGIELPMAA
jgi:hypothetical protein